MKKYVLDKSIKGVYNLEGSPVNNMRQNAEEQPVGFQLKGRM